MDLKTTLLRLSQGYLHQVGNTSEDSIEISVRFNANAPIFSNLSEEDIQEVILKIQEIEGIEMDLCSIIEDESDNFEEWLNPERKQKLNEGYWYNYEKLLSQKGGFSDNVITTIGLDTEKIISKCGDPENKKIWDRKGLVIGSVQSGKTANYIGLITKAADLGYKVIIVIAGRDNNLRQQTQKRINDGFIKPTSIMNDVKTPSSITDKFDFDSPALQRIAFKLEKDEKLRTIEIIETPGVKSIEEVKSFFDTDVRNCIKTLVVTDQANFYCVCLRGDHELNFIKLQKLLL